MLTVVGYLYIKEVVTYHSHHIIFSRNNHLPVFIYYTVSRSYSITSVIRCFGFCITVIIILGACKII